MSTTVERVDGDEKSESINDEQNVVTKLNNLFEEYRLIREITFDTTKQGKAAKLNNIKNEIKSLIDWIDERYPYKATLNLSNNGKKSKTQSTSSSNSNMDETKSAISRAEYLYFVGSYYKLIENNSLALSLMMESIKLNPDLIECWNNLGDLYYGMNEILASKYCFESALTYSRQDKIAHISLSKIMRKPMSGNDQMETMEQCISSLVLAKKALKYAKKEKLKDGELWFNLGNAYLMAFLNCANGFKLNSSIELEEEIKNESSTKNKDSDNDKLFDDDFLNGLDSSYFVEEFEDEAISKKIRREIESELNDESNNLLNHIYIKKCLNSYKCASTKCTINKHGHHPDLYCNRSHIHIYQENYCEALKDLKLSIKYSSIDINDGGENGNECQAKIMSDELLPKLCKISKQIATKGGSNKMAKKLISFGHQIRSFHRQISDYYTAQLHYDLVDFDALSEGFNGGNVIVLKVLSLMQPANQLPFHFIAIDHKASMFVLSFYLRGHALNQIHKIVANSNINASTLIAVANPVKRRVKFTHGSKNIDFYTICFQKAQDVCIGGKFFFQKK